MNARVEIMGWYDEKNQATFRDSNTVLKIKELGNFTEVNIDSLKC